MIKIGTRGSALALAQAGWVRDRLADAWPDETFQLEVIKTTGDIQREMKLAAAPGKGVFVKEIEEALLDGRVHAAIHSLKDLPTALPPGLVLGATPEREDPRDCLVGEGSVGVTLDALPEGAIVGTGSPRRACQLKNARPDLDVRDIRGNVDTRLAKREAGDYHAVVLAAAGLNRLSMAHVAAVCLEPDVMLPAVGQGILAIEMRDGDEQMAQYLAAIDHPPSHAAAAAERAMLQGLGGGCATPVAAFATTEGETLNLEGLVASPDGAELIREQLSGPVADAEKLGSDLAARLKAAGADRLLAADH